MNILSDGPNQHLLSIHSLTNINDEPSLEKALSYPDAGKWKEAIQAELLMLSESGCFKLVERLKNVTVYPSKWIIKVKRGKEGKILK